MLQSADGQDLYQDENMVEGADAGDIADPEHEK